MSIGLSDNVEVVALFLVEFSVRSVVDGTLGKLHLLGRMPPRWRLVVIMRRGVYRPDQV